MPYPQPAYIDPLQGSQDVDFRQLYLMADGWIHITVKGHVCFNYNGYWWSVFRNATYSPSSIDFTVYRTANLDSSTTPTWTEQDYSNRPVGIGTSADIRWGAQMVGSKLYIFHQHTTGLGYYGVRVYIFNMATQTWVSGYVTGLDDNAVPNWHSTFFTDIVVSGTNIIVFHNRPSEAFSTPLNCYYSVYDTISDTYSSTFNGVGHSTDPYLAGRALVHADGRISFFYKEQSTTRYWHRVWNGSWGTAQDISTTLPGGTYDLLDTWGRITFARPLEWNGQISFANLVRHIGFASGDIVRFYASTGSDTPTWNYEVLATHAVTNPNDNHHVKDMIIHGSSLTVIYSYLYDGQSRLLYQTNSGSGWSAQDGVLYHYEDNPPEHERTSGFGIRIANADFVATDCPLFGGIQMIVELGADETYVGTLMAYNVGCDVCCSCDEAY